MAKFEVLKPTYYKDSIRPVGSIIELDLTDEEIKRAKTSLKLISGKASKADKSEKKDKKDDI